MTNNNYNAAKLPSTSSNGGFILFLSDLSFAVDDEIRRPYTTANLVAAYTGPLDVILESPLLSHGFISRIIVDFGVKGCYELNTMSTLDTEPTRFERQLGKVFDGRMVSDADGNIVWTHRPKFTTNLPVSIKIGFLAGDNNSGIPTESLGEFVESVDEAGGYMLVIGKICGTKIQKQIDKFVKVTSYQSVSHAHVLNRVLTRLAENLDLEA